MPDAEIGTRYGISFGTLERMITETYGANVTVLKKPKRIRRWTPPDFCLETSTVWSFRQRGRWATHSGRYRGNWSPYIPRNLILRYSRLGDVVLDYFVGGGTTAVEAKLLGRRCIARDINPQAINLTREVLAFQTPPHLVEGPLYEPEVSPGDARALSDISSNSVDLICAHPPYAGIIRYSSGVKGDLSALSIDDFLLEMGKVARESLRVLKPGGKCAILIGDARKSKHVIPIGFQTIRVFLNAGFILRELVIKRQHNCKTTGFWYTRSIQYNFLLLAHEYLPIFEKPSARHVAEQPLLWESSLPYQTTIERIRRVQEENLETTTVWIFPRERLQAEIKRNLVRRFAHNEGKLVEIRLDGGSGASVADAQDASLVYVRSPERRLEERELGSYRATLRRIVRHAQKVLAKEGGLILEAEDFRVGGRLIPMGLILWEEMAHDRSFRLKEIVTVVPEEAPGDREEECLRIVHRYLLLYVRV